MTAESLQGECRHAVVTSAKRNPAAGKLMTRMGRMDEIAHDHFFRRDTVAEMLQICVNLAAESDKGRVHGRAVPRPGQQRPQR